MDNQPDVNLRIPDGYGIVNECFNRKEPIIAAPKVLNQDHQVPKTLQRLVADLEVLISVPIYESRIGSRVQSGRLIGVLNLDSKTPGAFEIFKNNEALLLQVKRRMETIAALFSRMIV